MSGGKVNIDFKEPMPVVTADRRYGPVQNVTINHLYEQDGVDGMSLYHPSNPPYEVSDFDGGKDLGLNQKQARSLRDQLNALDLGDNDTKGK